MTGTASGKTLCYNLPILDSVLKDPLASALYIFPTKALAHDQQKCLLDIVNDIGVFAENIDSECCIASILVSIYDGDTPQGHRKNIRSIVRLLLTNPDMLHVAILPHHTLWKDFFGRLRYIVIDEIHTYRGIFGSHVPIL